MGAGTHRSGESWIGKRIREALHSWAGLVPVRDGLEEIRRKISELENQIPAQEEGEKGNAED